MINSAAGHVEYLVTNGTSKALTLDGAKPLRFQSLQGAVDLDKRTLKILPSKFRAEPRIYDLSGTVSLADKQARLKLSSNSSRWDITGALDKPPDCRSSCIQRDHCRTYTMKTSWIVLTVCLVLSIGVVTRHPMVTLASATATASGQPAPSQSPSAQSSGSHRLADSAEAKFMHIQQNGEKPRPDPAPTVFTEEEINAYLTSGRVELPQGVKRSACRDSRDKSPAF